MGFGKSKTKEPHPVYLEFVFGSLSSGGAAVVTHPIDLLKVRQQILESSSERSGSFRIGSQILKNEGVFGLYRGLSASLARQFTYSGARIGSYPLIKNSLQRFEQNEELSLWKKIFAGMLAGAIGAVIGNPADLINVRMQADSKLAIELRRNYSSVLDGLVKIVRNEGVLSLWGGCKPNVIRAMFMTASQLASYDQIKQLLLSSFPEFFHDNLTTHFCSGALAGFIATVVTSPVDVVKTRLMNDTQKQYRSILDCITKTWKINGFLGFYKGFGPNVMRLLPQTILTFIFYEQIENAFLNYRKNHKD